MPIDADKLAVLRRQLARTYTEGMVAGVRLLARYPRTWTSDQILAAADEIERDMLKEDDDAD